MTGRFAVSVKLMPELLQAAQSITGISDVSYLLDEGLSAPIKRELEKRWLATNRDDELPGEVCVDLNSAPWVD